MVDLVARVQLVPSKSEARRLVQSGGVYVNNRRMSDPQARLTREQAIGGRLFVLRKGQKQNTSRPADLTGGSGTRYCLDVRIREIPPGVSQRSVSQPESSLASLSQRRLGSKTPRLVDRAGALVTLEGSPKRAAHGHAARPFGQVLNGGSAVTPTRGGEPGGASLAHQQSVL